MQTDEATREKMFTVDDKEETWSEGPGVWSGGYTGTTRFSSGPEDDEDDTSDKDDTVYEAYVKHVAGYESMPTDDASQCQPYRLTKATTYTTAGKYATREEAEAARPDLIAYLKSTGQMPENPNWQKFEGQSSE